MSLQIAAIRAAHLTCPPPLLTPDSPRWNLLTRGEQRVARATAEGYWLLVEPMLAFPVLIECLGDLRMARTAATWDDLAARLRRVQQALLGDLDTPSFAQFHLISVRARLVLLGADRDHAERMAEALIGYATELLYAGQRAPTFAITPDGTTRPHGSAWDERGVREWEEGWEREGQLLRPATLAGLDDHVVLEIHALLPDRLSHTDGPPGVLPTDVFQAARGVPIARTGIDRIPEPVPHPSDEFAREAVEVAGQHASVMLEAVNRVLDDVRRAHQLTSVERRDAAMLFQDMSRRFAPAWANRGVQEALLRLDCGGFEVAGVACGNSAHETIHRLAERVIHYVRRALREAVFAGSSETDRAEGGPWYGQEIAAALRAFGELAPELTSPRGEFDRLKLEPALDKEYVALVVEVRPTRGKVPPAGEGGNVVPSGSAGVPVPPTPVKKKAGRKAVDAKGDERILARWLTGAYPTYKDLALNMKITLLQVKRAVMRARKAVTRAERNNP